VRFLVEISLREEIGEEKVKWEVLNKKEKRRGICRCMS
jgi:hypothetical protein